ncbi:MAG: methyltransferase domain-containing protein [Patescibacteria group bacterium]
MITRSGTELIDPFKLLERVGLREDMRVADFGCGSLGHFVFPAAERVGGMGAVYAVDVQKGALERIAKMAKDAQLFNITPVWSDFDVYRAAQIDDASLDLLLLVNNLMLSQNHEQLVREMARLTRPGGRIVVVDWTSGPSPFGPRPDQRITPSSAKNLLLSPLMKFYDEFAAGPYHYGLIYLRTDEAVG